MWEIAKGELRVRDGAGAVGVEGSEDGARHEAEADVVACLLELGEVKVAREVGVVRDEDVAEGVHAVLDCRVLQRP